MVSPSILQAPFANIAVIRTLNLADRNQPFLQGLAFRLLWRLRSDGFLGNIRKK